MDSEMISAFDRKHIPGQGHESLRVWMKALLLLLVIQFID